MEGLAFAARQELKRPPPFKDYGKSPVPAELAEVDRQAQHILTRSQLLDVGIPALTTGGLFNSTSIALTADELLAPELRLRTAVEMSLNSYQYKNRNDFNSTYRLFSSIADLNLRQVLVIDMRFCLVSDWFGVVN